MTRPGRSIGRIPGPGPGGCAFDTLLRQIFCKAIFCFSSQRLVRKIVIGFGKVVSILVRESMETRRCVPECHDTTLILKS